MWHSFRGGLMKRFEYEVTKHPNKDFSNLVYFCTGEGECSIDQVPSDQTKVLEGLFNTRGSDGWELVQTFFGTDGVVMFWKREMPS